MFENWVGGTPQIPIWDIWSDVQSMVGTPHIPSEVIWSDVQTRLGTPHKALEQLGWRHRITLKDKLELIKSISRVGGGVGGRSNVILDPTLAFIRAQLGFRIQVWAECGSKQNISVADSVPLSSRLTKTLGRDWKNGVFHQGSIPSFLYTNLFST